MTTKNNSLLIVTSIIMIISALFMGIGGIFSFFSGGLASFFFSSWGLKTAFGGLISVAMAALVGTAGVQGMRYAIQNKRSTTPLLLGCAISILFAISLIIALICKNANIFDFTNTTVAILFTYGAYKQS